MINGSAAAVLNESVGQQLVPIALGRYRERRGVALEPSDVWVVGDTPNDFDGASAAGAHCLLVATGSFAREVLVPLGADAVVDDLSDTDAVLAILTGEIGTS